MTLRSWRHASRITTSVLIAISALSATSSASAFCRTITAPLPEGYNPVADGCYEPSTSTGYIPLWWANACVGFSVQEDASKQVSWADADAIAQKAFAKWSAVTCESAGDAGIGSPSILAEDEGAVACSQIGYSESGPNQHVIVFRDDNWPHDDQYNTLALTTVTFDTDTGEILDADMEVNTAQHRVVVTTPVPSGAYDLESIFTHEAGHFLGLAHTPTKTAIMYAFYQPESTALTPDDVDGICAAYLPNGVRVTDQNENGSIKPVSVQESSCNPTPLAGFGSQCGPLGVTTRTTGGCTIAAGTGAGSGDAGRGAVVLAAIALGAALMRRRGATLSPMRMKRVRAILTCSLVALGGAAVAGLALERDAHASIAITVLFDELVRDSSGAALVTPMEQRAVWENGRIFTFTRVHVDRAIAGTIDSDPWVRTMGGVVGKVGQLVDGEPVLTVGRPGLLFMQPLSEEGPGVYIVTARAQGQFPVVVDAQNTQRFVRSSAVGAGVPTPRERVVQISRSRAMSGLASGAPLATDVLHKRPIEDGVRDVAAAWTRIHGSR
jgi:hypothetical protein